MDKFKIGDKVRAVKEFEDTKPTGIGTIKQFYGQGRGITVEFSDWKHPNSGANTWNYRMSSAEACLEHMLAETGSKKRNEFEPGDRVVRINVNNGGCAQIGQEATVMFFDPSRDMVYVTYPGHHNEKHDGEGWMAHNTKRLEASASTRTHEFKPGDCGKTESGKPYKVMRITNNLLDVEINGELMAMHCYLNGKCYADSRSCSENLLPPNRCETDAKSYEFKPGDRVRVMRTAKGGENGWNNVWVPSMNDTVGQEFVVEKVHAARGVHFKDRYESFPPFVLELLCKAETNTDITNQKTEDTYMLKIEDRTYIDGTNANDYTDDHLIRKISEAEAEVARLKSIGTKSAKVEARIAELEAGAKRLAEILDARA